MAKKVVSLALHKKKPIKNTTTRRHLKSVFKKFFNYMKSDTFMYAPLASPHSYLTFPPPPFDEPMKKKGVLQDDANYLKSDCYMYAPLVESAIGEKNGGVCEERREESRRAEEKIPDRCSDIEYHNPVRRQRVVLGRTMLQKETVK
ncbi:hypothetical protein ACS0TY_024391 [Phlomoides rotata]